MQLIAFLLGFVLVTEAFGFKADWMASNCLERVANETNEVDGTKIYCECICETSQDIPEDAPPPAARDVELPKIFEKSNAKTGMMLFYKECELCKIDETSKSSEDSKQRPWDPTVKSRQRRSYYRSPYYGGYRGGYYDDCYDPYYYNNYYYY